MDANIFWLRIATGSESFFKVELMAEFFTTAAGLLGKLGTSLAGRELGEKIKDIRTKRRMDRMVEDAVDRIVEQIDGFLTGENVGEHRKQVLIASLCSNLQPLADNPQDFFVGNLDGATLFKQRHPAGKLPDEIKEEDLGHFYTMLFPQIAHFLAGSRIALAQWQAEGYREEFKRLTQIAEEIRAMNVKVADLPAAVTHAFGTRAEKESEALLREFSQTLLNNLLLRLDLSPLRAERSLHGSMRDHFVIPAFRERKENSAAVGHENIILESLAIQGARRIVHGGAGVGKTTWSLWLQTRLLESEPGRLPIVLRLREAVDIEKHSLLDLLRERAGVHLREGISDRVLKKWHASGRLVVILDGFDEVPEDRRDSVEKWIKDLDSVAKKTAIIVTSRPLQSGHLESLKKPWQQWDLMPFDEPRIFEFIERWHRYLPDGELSAAERKVDPRSIARSFFNDPSLRPLADTPLMLGTLLFVHHRDKKLPSGRVDLYERYIAAMLGLRDSGMGVQARATKLTDREKRRVLSHIAIYFHLNSVDQVNDEMMRTLVRNALASSKFDEEVERLLPALRERTGLLQGPGAWSFTHKTIGEFLVAELICEGTTRFQMERLDRKELWVHRHKDNWTSVIFFWAGKTSPRELEDFIFDLLREMTKESSLLALSILYDQGDRISFDMQRSAAALLITKPLLVDVGTGRIRGSVHSVTPVVPRLFYSQENSAPLIELRGLSSATTAEAFVKLFAQGILLPSDLVAVDKPMRDILSVAALRALGEDPTRVTFEQRGDFSFIPARELALYCFRETVMGHIHDERYSIQHVRDILAKWVRAFPQGKSWVSLLLAGVITNEGAVDYHHVSAISRRVGTLLWDWRNEPVDDEWLLQSDDCSGWAETKGVDVITQIDDALASEGADNWGITVEQHSDLLAWCDRFKTRRTELKSAVTSAERSR